MSIRVKQTAHFANLFIDGSKLNTGMNSTEPFEGMSVSSEAQVNQVEDVRFENLDVIVTDTGGVNGGFVAIPLFRMPITYFRVTGSYLNLVVNSLGAGLTDGTYPIAVGFTAANDDSFTIIQQDIIDENSLVVSSGTGEVNLLPTVSLIQNWSSSGAIVYLNIGIPNASISANSTMNITGKFRLMYLDLSDGV